MPSNVSRNKFSQTYSKVFSFELSKLLKYSSHTPSKTPPKSLAGSNKSQINMNHRAGPRHPPKRNNARTDIKVI